MVWTRQESLLARQKRHPFVMHYRTGATSEGTIVAQDVRILGTPALTRCSARGCCSRRPSTQPAPTASTTLGSKASPRSRTPCPRSAMRGFGAMQVVFAYESQMDRLAQLLGLDAVEVRERNFVVRGDRRVTGEQIDTEPGVRECLRRALDELGERSAPGPGRRVGRGFACSMQPYGRSMVLRRPRVVLDRARARWDDGRARRRHRSRRGSVASLADIAGEVLGVTVERTSVHIGDSALTPLTGGTFATRQLYMSGNAALKVARILRDKLAPVAADVLDTTGPRAFRDGRGHSPTTASDRGRCRARCHSPRCRRQSEERACMPHQPGNLRGGAGNIRPRDRKGRTFPDYTLRHARRRRRGGRGNRTGARSPIRRLPRRRTRDRPRRVEGQIKGRVAQGIGYALSRKPRSSRRIYPTQHSSPTTSSQPRLDLPTSRSHARDVRREGPIRSPRDRRTPDRSAGGDARQCHRGRRRSAPAATADVIRACPRSAARRGRAPSLVAPMTEAAAIDSGDRALALVRRRRADSLQVQPPPTAPQRFHAQHPRIRNDTAWAAPAAAARLGVREVLVKDESSRLGLPSFKVLGASWRCIARCCIAWAQTRRTFRRSRHSSGLWRRCGR